MRSVVVLLAMAVLLTGCGGGGSGTDLGRSDVVSDGGPDGAADVPADGTGDVPEDRAGTDTAGEESSELPPADAEDASDSFVMPDALFVHAVREHADKVVDSPVLVDEPVQYRTLEKLPDLDVRAIAAVGDTVWAATATGVVRYDAGQDLFVAVALPSDVAVMARRLGADAGPVLDLATTRDGLTIAVAKSVGIDLVGANGDAIGSLEANGTCTSVSFRPDGYLVAGTTDGVFGGLLGGFGPVAGTDGWDVKDVEAIGMQVFAITADGQLHQDLATVTLPAGLGKAIRLGAVRGDSESGVWVACENGMARVSGDGTVEQTVLAAKGGLPADTLTAVDAVGDDVLVGHLNGASASRKNVPDTLFPYDHYASERWLPADAVTGVAIGADGSRWIATAKGVTRVEFRQRRIAQKADSEFDLWMAHFWRMDGFLMSDAGNDDAWNPTTWTTSDFDNDGLWTQMGIGALCYAYDLTKDEKYYQAARKAMDNMFLEIDVPAVDFEQTSLGRGFITRSLVREDEGALYTSKLSQSNWHPVTYKGVHYVWKDDTSSDETTGHFFGFPLYYDLCAKDDAERAAVAEHAGALAKYIVDGDYTLRDLDGQPTSFGHFEPSHVSIAVDGLEACADAGWPVEDCIGAMYGAGWLNGIEILGHLLAAWHMTGDRFFYDAYDKLIRQHRYDEVAVTSRVAETVNNPKMANHSDHELAMLAYATLIRYEPNEDRRAKWIDSLEGLYEYEVAERQPLWAAVVALAKPGVAEVSRAVQTLREMPRDQRDWRVDNTYRKDATSGPSDRHGGPQFDTVFPYDEIRTMWWNGNPYAKADGSWGRNLVSPTAFQLAYWAQRYAGILVEPPAK